MTWRYISGLLLVFLLLGRSSPSFAVEGPSFDCSNGVRQTLAAILCADPAAAQADWEVSSAYWAFYSDDREESAFNQMVNQRCALPVLETAQQRAGRMLLGQIGGGILGTQLQLPSPRAITPVHVRCVVEAFRERANVIRAKLTGDRLREAQLSPEEHIAVQQALITKGFMQNRVKAYGASADGQFGPNTRVAINSYQASIGAATTGFLSDDQRLSLLEDPEQRAAREARASAEEKTRMENVKRQRADEERRKQEAAVAEEAAKRAEAQAKQDAIDREKRRLEQEAAKAAEWQNRIQEAQAKGIEYAKGNDLNWSLTEKLNPMTDDKDYEVSSTQKNERGAVALVQGRCFDNGVRFEAVLHDEEDPKLPLGLPGSSQGGLIGKKRINGEGVFATSFPLDKFRNRIVFSQLSFRQDDSESADTTWRVLAELETSQGTLYLKLPLFDPKIQKLLSSCKRQSVITERRQNGPG
ncbi:peptidoglycan hydrolase-like protein with peptidoglycan-binding domain [Bradyrhizobium sp. USDA 4448]